MAELPQLREGVANWTLAQDSELLGFLQGFSDRLISKTKTTETAVESLVFETAAADASLHNAFNEFVMLSNFQFIENRIYEDEDVVATKEPEEAPPDNTMEALMQRYADAVAIGMRAVVDVAQQHAEGPEGAETAHAAMIEDEFTSRALPYIISTPEFEQDKYCGLDFEDEPEASATQLGDEVSDSDEERENRIRSSVPAQNGGEDGDLSSEESDTSEVGAPRVTVPSGAVGHEESESEEESDSEEDGLFGVPQPPKPTLPPLPTRPADSEGASRPPLPDVPPPGKSRPDLPPLPTAPGNPRAALEEALARGPAPLPGAEGEPAGEAADGHKKKRKKDKKKRESEDGGIFGAPEDPFISGDVFGSAPKRKSIFADEGESSAPQSQLDYAKYFGMDQEEDESLLGILGVASTKKSSLFDEDEPATTAAPSKPKPKATGDLFGEEEEDIITPKSKPANRGGLFGEEDETDPLGDTAKATSPEPDEPSAPSQPLPPQPKVAKPVVKQTSLFGGDEDEGDLFGSKAPASKPSKKPVAGKTSLFDEDEDITFAAKPAKKKESIKPASNLFGELDEDEDLFGFGDTTKVATEAKKPSNLSSLFSTPPIAPISSPSEPEPLTEDAAATEPASTKATAVKPKAAPSSSLFDSPELKSAAPANAKKVSSLFDEDSEDLFAPKAKPAPKATAPPKTDPLDFGVEEAIPDDPFGLTQPKPSAAVEAAPQSTPEPTQAVASQAEKIESKSKDEVKPEEAPASKPKPEAKKKSKSKRSSLFDEDEDAPITKPVVKSKAKGGKKKYSLFDEEDGGEIEDPFEVAKPKETAKTVEKATVGEGDEKKQGDITAMFNPAMMMPGAKPPAKTPASEEPSGGSVKEASDVKDAQSSPPDLSNPFAEPEVQKEDKEKENTDGKEQVKSPQTKEEEKAETKDSFEKMFNPAMMMPGAKPPKKTPTKPAEEVRENTSGDKVESSGVKDTESPLPNPFADTKPTEQKEESKKESVEVKKVEEKGGEEEGKTETRGRRDSLEKMFNPAMMMPGSKPPKKTPAEEPIIEHKATGSGVENAESSPLDLSNPFADAEPTEKKDEVEVKDEVKEEDSNGRGSLEKMFNPAMMMPGATPPRKTPAKPAAKDPFGVEEAAKSTPAPEPEQSPARGSIKQLQGKLMFNPAMMMPGGGGGPPKKKVPESGELPPETAAKSTDLEHAVKERAAGAKGRRRPTRRSERTRLSAGLESEEDEEEWVDVKGPVSTPSPQTTPAPTPTPTLIPTPTPTSTPAPATAPVVTLPPVQEDKPTVEPKVSAKPQSASDLPFAKTAVEDKPKPLDSATPFFSDESEDEFDISESPLQLPPQPSKPAPAPTPAKSTPAPVSDPLSLANPFADSLPNPFAETPSPNKQETKPVKAEDPFADDPLFSTSKPTKPATATKKKAAGPKASLFGDEDEIFTVSKPKPKPKTTGGGLFD